MLFPWESYTHQTIMKALAHILPTYSPLHLLQGLVVSYSQYNTAVALHTSNTPEAELATM